MAKELEERRDDPPATAASTVADELLSLILGELAPGASLPSESDLAQRYDVSRLTVREAVKMLAGRGLLELARGAKLSLTIEWDRVPVLEGVRALAQAGFVTGASGRNWAGYGSDVKLPADFAEADRALLTDPQTSGGLLVSCTPDSVSQVLDVFRRHGFGQAAVIGQAQAQGAARLTVR